ncbi:MAG: hypothetical protein BWY09_01283 [Candidatus Hydrogenedentes bacterium ADurb.Bin179]|nr:MAG: hypothetical protein BWY09_01283 [Candidatus Hydrogenedentes bacterium ADurb.Bin179]
MRHGSRHVNRVSLKLPHYVPFRPDNTKRIQHLFVAPILNQYGAIGAVINQPEMFRSRTKMKGEFRVYIANQPFIILIPQVIYPCVEQGKIALKYIRGIHVKSGGGKEGPACVFPFS